MRSDRIRIAESAVVSSRRSEAISVDLLPFRSRWNVRRWSRHCDVENALSEFRRRVASRSDLSGSILQRGKRRRTIFSFERNAFKYEPQTHRRTRESTGDGAELPRLLTQFSRSFHYEIGFESLTIETIWFDHSLNPSACSSRLTLHQLHFHFSAKVANSTVQRLLSNVTALQNDPPLRLVVETNNNHSSIFAQLCFPVERSFDLTTAEPQLIFGFSSFKK